MWQRIMGRLENLDDSGEVALDPGQAEKNRTQIQNDKMWVVVIDLPELFMAYVPGTNIAQDHHWWWIQWQVL